MTLKFPDLSHYKTGVDVAKYPALITKACEGTSMVDATFKGYKSAAAKAGIPFLGYHFLKHGAISAQVAHAIAVVGHGQPLMLDVETAGDGTVATLADVYSFADQYKAAGGRVTLAYIPHWYWQGKWHSPSLAGLTQRSIGLISSNYTTYSDSGPGWTGYGGVKPVIWQYTASATSQDIDMNAFKGSVAELAALFAGTTLEDEDDMDEATFIKYFQAAIQADGSIMPKAQPDGPRLAANTNGWSVASGLEAVNNMVWAMQSGLAEKIAAKLAPSLTGMTEAQIRTAVDASLAELTLTAAPPPAS